jgi:hypothetical protein
MLSAPKIGRESDQIIVLGDGSAERMGKGLTGICSLQRKRVPIRKIGGKHADLTGGNSEESDACFMLSFHTDANIHGEPGAGIPHAGT